MRHGLLHKQECARTIPELGVGIADKTHGPGRPGSDSCCLVQDAIRRRMEKTTSPVGRTREQLPNCAHAGNLVVTFAHFSSGDERSL